MANHIAIAEAAVGAPIAKVWAALTDTEAVADRGVVVEATEPTRLRVSHRALDSDATSEVKYELSDLGETTHVKITQNHLATTEAAAQSSQAWQTMLQTLKRAVEEPA